MNGSLKTPNTAVFEATARCNLRCAHCGLSCAPISKVQEMTIEQIETVFAKLKTFGVSNLIVSGGEFTLREDWQEIIRIALINFSSVRLITNGRLGALLAKTLLVLPDRDRLTVSVSLDGDRETHDARRGAGSFDLADETIVSLTPIDKSVITTVTKENFLKLIPVLQFCLDRRIEIWSVQLGLPAGRMPKSSFLERADLLKLADFIWCAQQIGEKNNLQVLADDCFFYRHPMRDKLPWRGCPAGRELITVHPDGSLTGCPTMPEFAIGNLCFDDLPEMWEKAFDVVRHKPTTCEKCSLCPGGCQAVAKIFNRQFCA